MSEEIYKTAKEIAIWYGLDNHPELEDCNTMEEYAKLKIEEYIKNNKLP